jgi:uncharacterized membrane protein
MEDDFIKEIGELICIGSIIIFVIVICNESQKFFEFNKFNYEEN